MAQDSVSVRASAPSAAAAAPAGPSAVPGASPASVPATKDKAPSKRLFFVLGAAVIAAAAGTVYVLHERHFEDTDDAQIDGTISSISPRVSGTVTAVYVVENQAVKTGDVLAEIDPSDLQIALAQAKAQVAQAEAQLDGEDPSVQITQATNTSAIASAQSEVAGASAGISAARKEVEQLSAQLAQAEANDRTAQLERGRSEKLVAEGAVAQADFDERNNAAAASTANVAALRQALAAAKDRVAQQQAQSVAAQSRFTEVSSNAPRQVTTRRASVGARKAALDLAKAQLAQAEKNVSYTKIIAPVSGIIAKKAVALGDYVAPGQQIIALSQTEGLYVTANFRETQLEHMQPSQVATIHVDALGADFRGSVESVGGTTGSRLSVLPPENAAGNYVKVVQRIPVRIRLDPGQPGVERARIGMSVEPRVTVR